MLRETRGRRATATSPLSHGFLCTWEHCSRLPEQRWLDHGKPARVAPQGMRLGLCRMPIPTAAMMRDGAETSGANSKPTLLTAPTREHAELAETALLTAEGCQCRGLPMGCGARWEREGIKHEVHEDGEPGLQVSVALLSFSNHPLPFLFFSSCVDCFGIWGWNHGIWRCNPALFLFFG